jgi:hypothetical protein
LNSDDSLNRGFLRCVFRLLLPGLFAGLCGAPTLRSEEPATPARAADGSAVSIEKIEVGFRGLSKVGEPTPVWVTLISPGDRQVTVVVDASDPDDNIASVPTSAVQLKAGAAERIETCVRSGRLNGDLRVRVNDDAGRTIAFRRLSPSSEADAAYHPALKLDTPLWLTVGKLELTSADAGVDSGAGSLNPQVVALDSLAELPLHWRALQSVEMLVLPTGRVAGGGTSLLAQISAGRDAMLRDWVRGGGHLLISVASEIDEYQKSPLAAWSIPVALEGQFPLRLASSLESYSGTNAPLRMGVVSAAKMAKVEQPNILVRDPGSAQTLIASVPFGFGRVTLVGLDIDAAPIASWPGLKPLLQKIATTGAGSMGMGTTGAGGRKANRQLTHVGVSDLATQFQQTHEDFPAVSRPSYWSVMGLILLYVAVIGPLDYFLVHRVLRRPELTWFTFALMVAGAVMLAAWTAGRVNGFGLQINQFDLIDVDAASGTTRNTTWTSLYSPEHRRFSVSVEPSAGGNPLKTLAPVEMAWMAVPENAVGGLYRTGAGSFGGRSYRFSADAASVENVPVMHWSTKSLSATWSDELQKPVVDCHLENLGPGQLRGNVTLLLDEPLEDFMLVANGWAYLPTATTSALKPGVEWQIQGGGKTVRNLKSLLTGEKLTRREKGEKSVSATTEITTTIEPYHPLGRNRSQQVAMISFHEATGGSGYTGLTNLALRNLELTDLMQLGRAVLIGRIAKSPARVVVDGAPVTPASQSTWVRFVLPVASKEYIPDKLIPKASERTSATDPSAGGKP